MCPLAFVAGSLQCHRWGFISRNYVVWPFLWKFSLFLKELIVDFYFSEKLPDTKVRYLSCQTVRPRVYSRCWLPSKIRYIAVKVRSHSLSSCKNLLHATFWCVQLFCSYSKNKLYEAQTIINKDLSLLTYILQLCLPWRQQVKRTVSESHSQLTAVSSGSSRVKCWDKTFFVAGQAGWFFLGISLFTPPKR